MKTTINHPCGASPHAKKSLLAALLLAGIAQADITHAAVVNTGDQLTITAATYDTSNITFVNGGSYFMMDTNGSFSFSVYERFGIEQGTQGLIIGITQPSPGTTHSGPPTGTEGGLIDAAWAFLFNTGMHITASPVTGSTTAGLDFNGWRMTWNGIPSIPLGGGIQDCGTTNDGICVTPDSSHTDLGGTFDNGTGVATFAWDGVHGHAYTLDYTATIPHADPSGFGGVYYGLHLEGSVNTVVPLPAAAWLFGSGLLGLIGIARRKKKE